MSDFQYKPRIADAILQKKLKSSGAVLVEGPKWCGKTTTSEQHAMSVNYICASKSNGNSIFLPAAGYRRGSSLYGAGSNGYYWSSSLNTGYSYNAYYLYFNSGFVDWYYGYRYVGQSVRPVCP